MLKPVQAEQDVETHLQDPGLAHDQDVLTKQLKHCMANLPAVQLEVFILSQETDLTLKMISDVVDASYEAVKTRLRYSKAALQNCLSKFGIYSSNNTASSEFPDER